MIGITADVIPFFSLFLLFSCGPHLLLFLHFYFHHNHTQLDVTEYLNITDLKSIRDISHPSEKLITASRWALKADVMSKAKQF